MGAYRCEWSQKKDVEVEAQDLSLLSIFRNLSPGNSLDVEVMSKLNSPEEAPTYQELGPADPYHPDQ